MPPFPPRVQGPKAPKRIRTRRDHRVSRDGPETIAPGPRSLSRGYWMIGVQVQLLWLHTVPAAHPPQSAAQTQLQVFGSTW